MAILHMETDSVRAMASQLKQVADDLRTQGMTLNNSAQTVDWMGPSHDEFVNEVNGILRQLDGQAGNGTALAKRVEDEVAEWEERANALTGGALGSIHLPEWLIPGSPGLPWTIPDSGSTPNPPNPTMPQPLIKDPDPEPPILL